MVALLYLWLAVTSQSQSVDEAREALEKLLGTVQDEVLLSAVEELLGMLRSASQIQDICEAVWELWPETPDFDLRAVHKAFGASATFGGSMHSRLEYLEYETFVPEGKLGGLDARRVIQYLKEQNPRFHELVELVGCYLATTLPLNDIQDFYTKPFLPEGTQTYWWWLPDTYGTVHEMLIVFYTIKYCFHCWIAARAKLAENPADEVAKIVTELKETLGGTGFAMFPEWVQRFFEALPLSKYTKKRDAS